MVLSYLDGFEIRPILRVCKKWRAAIDSLPWYDNPMCTGPLGGYITKLVSEHPHVAFDTGARMALGKSACGYLVEFFKAAEAARQNDAIRTISTLHIRHVEETGKSFREEQDCLRPICPRELGGETTGIRCQIL